MSREIVGKGLRFSLRHAPCAHICRYCLISESRKRSALPFARFEQLVHRFYDWKEARGRDDFTIGIFVGPSFDYDLETLKGVARLHARRGSKFQVLNLGGFAAGMAMSWRHGWKTGGRPASLACIHRWRGVARRTTDGTDEPGISNTRPQFCAWAASAAWCVASGCF